MVQIVGGLGLIYMIENFDFITLTQRDEFKQ